MLEQHQPSAIARMAPKGLIGAEGFAGRGGFGGSNIGTSPR
jgi:hypothetical protein